MHRAFVGWTSFVLLQGAASMLGTVLQRWTHQSGLTCIVAWKGWAKRRKRAKAMARRCALRWMGEVLLAWRAVVDRRILADSIVVQAPSITSQPQATQAVLGRSCRLHVVAVGSEPMQYVWHKNGSPLPDATSAVLEVKINSPADCGSFHCVVSNTAGSISSVAVPVTVLSPPVIIEGPQSRLVAEGETVKLAVRATGATGYRWYKDGVPVPGANKPYLDLVATTDTCGVPFVCEVSNPAGSCHTESATLRNALGELETRLVRATMWDMEIEWEPPSLPPGGSVEAYCVRVTEAVPDGEDYIVEDFILPGTKHRMLFDLFHGEPLVPAEVFRFIVTAKVRSGGPGGSAWTLPGAMLTAGTLPPSGRVVLLEGKRPRVFVVKPLVFESGSDRLFSGSDTDLPEVAELLKAIPELALSVEGHVNFGTTASAACDLSKKRARAVRVRLMSLGIDKSRLTDVGHGFGKPRYPKGSSLSTKNRRVEFVILNPEVL